MPQIAKDFTDFDYSNCDTMVSFAKANNIKFRAHFLMSGSGSPNPSWVRSETNMTKLEAFMLDYIESTVTHVGTNAMAWDVVNEAIDDANDASKIYKTVSPWYKIDNYICKAFTAAHKANPSAKLFYNDYKHASMVGEEKIKSDKVYNMIKGLVSAGCPIHGVAFQSHLDITIDDSSFEGIRSNIKRYNDLGLIVHISEIDVRCARHPKTCNVTSWPESYLERQAYVFSKILQVCLEQPNCVSFESWGITDKHSFLKSPNNGLPMDSDMKPKKAYYEMRNVLSNFSISHSAVTWRKSNGYGL